jgi:colanic acid biosynthesis protein WcaH
LGKRNNDPLKGEWFTPGGRIHKNETWQDALLRIAEAELGLNCISVENFSLIGMWDHFYNNSALDQNTSTHYVNLPHCAEFTSKPQITLDHQHGEFEWFDLTVVAKDEKFHLYVRNYASWLLSKVGKSDD